MEPVPVTSKPTLKVPSVMSKLLKLTVTPAFWNSIWPSNTTWLPPQVTWTVSIVLSGLVRVKVSVPS